MTCRRTAWSWYSARSLAISWSLDITCCLSCWTRPDSSVFVSHLLPRRRRSEEPLRRAPGEGSLSRGVAAAILGPMRHSRSAAGPAPCSSVRELGARRPVPGGVPEAKRPTSPEAAFAAGPRARWRSRSGDTMRWLAPKPSTAEALCTSVRAGFCAGSLRGVPAAASLLSSVMDMLSKVSCNARAPPWLAAGSRPSRICSCTARPERPK
mmetsp:Transcript_7691/g.21729  ORF Transcript_7691/g.21729 Transcript_7691/m.21729 type:complete len:209 (-) Transcript_7691:77-703(-)